MKALDKIGGNDRTHPQERAGVRAGNDTYFVFPAFDLGEHFVSYPTTRFKSTHQ